MSIAAGVSIQYVNVYYVGKRNNHTIPQIRIRKSLLVCVRGILLLLNKLPCSAEQILYDIFWKEDTLQFKNMDLVRNVPVFMLFWLLKYSPEYCEYWFIYVSDIYQTWQICFEVKELKDWVVLRHDFQRSASWILLRFSMMLKMFGCSFLSCLAAEFDEVTQKFESHFANNFSPPKSGAFVTVTNNFILHDNMYSTMSYRRQCPLWEDVKLHITYIHSNIRTRQRG